MHSQVTSKALRRSALARTGAQLAVALTAFAASARKPAPQVIEPDFPAIVFPADMPAHARKQIGAIDDACIKCARRVLADNPPPRELRRRADEYSARGLFGLADANRDLADLIEVDARLEAARCMGAMADGTTKFFLFHYCALVREAAARAKSRRAA